MVQTMVKKYAIYVVALVIAFVAGKYSRPAKVEIKEVIKRELVVKEVETQQEQGTVWEKEIINKDGTREITRVKDYRIDTRSEVDKLERETIVKTKKTSNLPVHHITLLQEYNKHLQSQDITLVYSHRIISTWSISGSVNSNLDTYGIGLSWGF